MAPRTLPSARLIELIDSYSRRIYAAVLEQHNASVVCSPLGIWLLLAACALGATGEDQRALEDTMGCSADDGLAVLSAFMARPPAALKAAIACWVSVADATEGLSAWVRRLPDQVESGYMPTQAEADAWADRNTLGLIKNFPVPISAATRIVLASALATKVSWMYPFETASVAEVFAARSPWHGKVERALWDQAPSRLAMIADTPSAGLVAVHAAVASEELTVLSVAADLGVARGAVLAGAHEVAAALSASESPACRVSLFDLAAGDGHSWSIREREIATYRPDQRSERIAEAFVPAWNADSELDLLSAPEFGCHAALNTLGAFLPPGADIPAAVQRAVSSFTQHGFEAAAITAFTRTASARMPPEHTGLERTATLRFDHPYAVIALAGQLDRPHDESEFFALPVFSAWVGAPQETEADS